MPCSEPVYSQPGPASTSTLKVDFRLSHTLPAVRSRDSIPVFISEYESSIISEPAPYDNEEAVVPGGGSGDGDDVPGGGSDDDDDQAPKEAAGEDDNEETVVPGGGSDDGDDGQAPKEAADEDDDNATDLVPDGGDGGDDGDDGQAPREAADEDDDNAMDLVPVLDDGHAGDGMGNVFEELDQLMSPPSSSAYSLRESCSGRGVCMCICRTHLDAHANNLRLK
ncbi:hypothetical protein N0V84_007824 [Fusarium piperis]|uniref:Uncharacterized protein n=1 Tax=Fusarium piperis TaxID=1435070 RepID=A0A9W9BN74_9HYPO|nr:hypothetical protein N0V84_007824 [Fusarium piperis]